MPAFRPAIAGVARRGVAATYAAAHAARLYSCRSAPVAFVTEGAEWTIHWIGKGYVDAIEARHPGTAQLVGRPYGLFGRIVHFGSQFHWQNWADILPTSNRYVVNYFHGKPGDGPEMARHVEFFLEKCPRLERIVTAASKVRRRLARWGVPAEKIATVPLGVDTACFRPPDEDEREAARSRLGVPKQAICVGSFQKDGVGWGDGREPKMIKGPDVFVAAMGRLARDHPVFVVLSGPARGYVKTELERLGIPFAHVYPRDYREIARIYWSLDLYLVASREEGGPQSVLESMASGVPLISTRVGMAEDVIAEGRNGLLVDVGDADALAARAAELAGDSDVRRSLRAAGRETATGYDWSVVAETLYENVYRELLS